MVRATFKNIAVALAILAVVIVILSLVDGSYKSTSGGGDTYLRVTVLDLQDKPVHNAKVTVGGEGFFTDNKGLSPLIVLVSPHNSYDSSITDWHTVNVSVQCDGYVSALIFHCVAYNAQTRRLTVRIYPNDSSTLPYVCYVESPPDEYVKSILNK